MALLSIPALEIMTMTSNISFYDAIKTDYRRHYANMLWINMYWTALECTHVPNKMATEHKLHYTRFYKKKKKKKNPTMNVQPPTFLSSMQLALTIWKKVQSKELQKKIIKVKT